MQTTSSRQAVIADRYMLENEKSEDDVWNRVAKFWGTDRQHEYQVRSMIEGRLAFPNTPAIANAGKDHAMGSACFVLPVEDDLVGINKTLSDATLVHKWGGGTGFSFGAIRPKGSLVSSTRRPAPGPVSFLRGYSGWLAEITQAGLRPGANMGILPITHPDVLEFIEAKAVEGDIHNFNISIACGNDFMDRVERGALSPSERIIWDRIVRGAWENGEPGIFFVDTVNSRRLHPELMNATNPCGEVPLRPYEACVLGSINLAAHIKGDGPDYMRLTETVSTLVELLDNVIERQHYPIPEIEREQKRYRKIGIGVMGYADALCELGLEYGSEDALEFAADVMSFIQARSYHASAMLGMRRGFYAGHKDGMPPRRNLNCQVIAPTGSIARLAECSFGIEPHFDTDDNGEFLSFVVGGKFTDKNVYYGAESWKPSSRVSIKEHVATQAMFQQYTDQAVSKTINCPFETTPEEIEEAYRFAWKTGCKGITVLRDESRKETVIAKTECEGDHCAL